MWVGFRISVKTTIKSGKKNPNPKPKKWNESCSTCIILYVQPCRTRSLAHTLCPFSASLSTRVFWLGVSLTWLRSKGAGLYPLVCMKLTSNTLSWQQTLAAPFQRETSLIAAHVLGSLVLFRFSSAFSSPIPTWQPKASRVLKNRPHSASFRESPMGNNQRRSSGADSLECLSWHCQVVVFLWFRKTLEVHQAGVQLLVVVTKLEQKEFYLFSKLIYFILNIFFILYRSVLHSLASRIWSNWASWTCLFSLTSSQWRNGCSLNVGKCTKKK